MHNAAYTGKRPHYIENPNTHFRVAPARENANPASALEPLFLDFEGLSRIVTLALGGRIEPKGVEGSKTKAAR
jgi:hypothetical protein